MGAADSRARSIITMDQPNDCYRQLHDTEILTLAFFVEFF